jgi:hypothetical protein
MKKAVFIIIIVAFAISGCMLSSCKKKSKDPAYPQFVGLWKGTTSQGKPVSVEVTNTNGDLYITSASIRFSQGTSDSASLSRTNSDGLYYLSGTTFSIVMDGAPPYESVMNGTFRTDTLLLTGTFTGYTLGSPTIPVTGTYRATKSN